MYKLFNNSLTKVLEKYKIAKLEDLNDAQLEYVCAEEIGFSPKFNYEDKNGRKIKTTIDRFATIRFIRYNKADSDFMPEPYWSPEIREMLNAAKWNEKLADRDEIPDGRAFYQFFQEFQIGYWELLPGQSIEVNFTENFMISIFLKTLKVRFEHLIVTDMTSGETLTPGSELKVIGQDTGKSEQEELNEMTTSELLEIARREIRPNIVKSTPKPALTRMIIKHRHE